MFVKLRCKVNTSSFFLLAWNLILYLHTLEGSQLNEADGIPMCFLFFQPTYALGDRNLFLLSILEDAQDTPKACISVTVLQIVQ